MSSTQQAYALPPTPPSQREQNYLESIFTAVIVTLRNGKTQSAKVIGKDRRCRFLHITYGEALDTIFYRDKRQAIIKEKV